MNRQTPFTKNQISNDKPNVEKSEVMLTGHIANSMNGGILKPIFYKKVMAGETHKEMRLQCKFHMLTPLTPAYQNLKITLRSFFVPSSRIWDNAEKYTAQNGGSSNEKIVEIPNLGGKEIPLATNYNDQDEFTNLSNTTAWRDSYISTYIPRMGTAKKMTQADVEGGRRDQYILPKVSVLPLRGVRAIFNDMFRNKEYQSEQFEYKGDDVSQAEWESYLPINGNLKNCMLRARKQNSYYSDYRTELQGLDAEAPELNNDAKNLTSWLQWENLVSEARSQAENAQLNPWDVIAKIRGSKKLTEGKVIEIGNKTFNLNYAAITQTTYNNNESINEEFRVMGKQGAYSYTEINLPIYAGMIFNEEGYVHTFAFVSADTVYETAFDRNLLNVTWDSEYRPDLVEQKDDVIYEIEYGTNYSINKNELYQVRGFKRTFNEMFKLANIIAGDMTSEDYYESNGITTEVYENKPIITQKTYQFFESSDRIFYLAQNGEAPIEKYVYLDYTDLLINKNQAIENEILGIGDDLRVGGQNQIFFAGQAYCICTLPISSEIIGNYTTWGEH